MGGQQVKSSILEKDVQRACMEFLAARGIPAIRLNVGAMSGSHKGKRWFVRFGTPGMADTIFWPSPTETVWLEFKRPRGGKQSEDQASFQHWVESIGHRYILCDDVDILISQSNGWKSL